MNIITIVKMISTVAILVIVIGSLIVKNRAAKAVWEYDDDALFEYVFDQLCKKSDYGYDLSQLNQHEKVFMAMSLIAMEVNNGGFDQFFLNQGTRWNEIIVPAAEAIKAYEVATICRQALEIYEEHSGQEDPIEELDVCDQEFYDCNDPYMSLIVKYARYNKEHFKIR